jgi:hypothetical protein
MLANHILMTVSKEMLGNHTLMTNTFSPAFMLTCSTLPTDAGDANMTAITWSVQGRRARPLLASGLGDT